MNKLFYFTAIAVVAVLACKKQVGLDPLPQNMILEYKVTNIPDSVIYGAIDNEHNTIDVYLPFYYGLTLIDPEIALSTGARLMEEAAPVLIDADTTGECTYMLNGGKQVTYTVKGFDGGTHTYTLKVWQQCAPPLAVTWGNLNDRTGYPNNMLPTVQGNFYTRNMALATWLLTDTVTGKIITLPKVSGNFSLTDSTYWSASVPIPADADTGYYKVSVRFSGQKASIIQPVHIIFKQPTPGSFIGSRTARQGDTISYTALSSVFVDPTAVTIAIPDGTIALPIVSFTRTEIRVKIPEDFPVGEYENVRFRFSFTGWGVPITRGNLTVNPK
jgi:hypothetical protein